MADQGDRRPLASRNTGWAHGITRRLAATPITPNQISMASMVAAAIAGAAFYLAGQSGGAARIATLLAGALFCQIRLLCNLFDGMVAVEAGRGSSDGVFWNEFPDRISDIVILVGIGYGIGESALGWSAAAFAVFTAYIRELGRASGIPADFSGPMAKPHRMAVVTVAAIASILEPLWGASGQVLHVALWLIAIGAIVTVLRRSSRLIGQLRK